LPASVLMKFITIFCILSTLISGIAIAQPISVRVLRWLSIQQLSGTVSYDRPSGSRPARVGDRLAAVGEGITTGAASRAELLLDTGVGVINVLEYTSLRVRRLDIAPDNGRITYLDVTRGQVRLKLRRFTNRGSELRIRTPAGLSGVRGTEFGVGVQPNGKTGIATIEGAVVTSAEGAQVAVPAGFQNLTIPGEPPSEAVPLRNDTTLQYRFVKFLDGNVRKVRLVGQVDSVNLVTVNGQPQSTDRAGRFSVVFLVPSFLRVNVVVTTPLGKTRSYEVALQ
jgi:hypothetical protein